MNSSAKARAHAPGARIAVAPATLDRWADVERVLDSAARGCWCNYYRLTSGEYSRSDHQERQANMLAWATRGDTPGMVAYLDDQPVGWLGFGPRARMGRLARSRTIPAVDDLPVWSVVCFAVRVGYRRRGVSRALLAGAIEFARSRGVPALEAYPVDPEGSRVDVAFGYVGFTHTFEAAGFRRVLETASHSDRRPRWLMRLDLRRAPDPALGR